MRPSKYIYPNNPSEQNISERQYWIDKARKHHPRPSTKKKFIPKPSIFEFAPEHIKNDREINLVAVTEGNEYFSDINDKFSNDKGFILECLKKGSGWSFINIPEHLKSDLDIFHTAYEKSPYCFKWMPYSFRSNREIVIELAKKDGLIIEHLPKSLRLDPEIAQICVEQNPKAIDFVMKSVSNKAFNDPKRANEIISKYPQAFIRIGYKLRNSKEFALPHIKKNPSFFLMHAGKSITDDEECMLSFAGHIGALGNLSDRLQHDEAFMLKAISIDNFNHIYAGYSLRIDTTFSIKAIQTNPSVFKNLIPEHRNDCGVLTEFIARSEYQLFSETWSEIPQSFIAPFEQEAKGNGQNTMEYTRTQCLKFLLQDGLIHKHPSKKMKV